MNTIYSGVLFITIFMQMPVLADNEVGNSVQTIEAGQSQLQGLSGQKYCKGCTPEAKKAYDTCSDKNNYLENSFQKLLSDKSSNYYHVRAAQILPETEYNKMETCIRESMKAHGGPFRQCDNRGIGLTRANAPKACMSKDYVQTATDSFVAVSDCFGGYLSSPESAESNDAVRRGLFSLISYESGFHTNAVSTTGSIGIGQFTTDTIRGVNKMVLDEVMNYAKSSNKASCKAIAKQELKPYTAVYKNRCEVISPSDGNPLKNLVYVVGIQKLNRQSLEKTIDTLPAKSRQAIANASPEFREKLINMMVNWSHNTGIGGVRRPFINFVTSKQGLELIAKEDIGSFSKQMAPLIGNYHENLISCPSTKEGESEEEVIARNRCERSKRGRIVEVTKFYKGIVDRQGVINQNAGATSGENKCGV